MTHTISSSDERGFGLVEATVATFITAIGVLSVAGLFLFGARMQFNSRTGSAAVGLATWELERIRNLVPTAPERLNGGSLTANVPNYFVRRGQGCDPVNQPQFCTTLRWQISDVQAPGAPGVPAVCAPAGGIAGAPSECAKNIVVVAITPNQNDVSPRVTSILFR
jgi:hypothetical protein